MMIWGYYAPFRAPEQNGKAKKLQVHELAAKMKLYTKYKILSLFRNLSLRFINPRWKISFLQRTYIHTFALTCRPTSLKRCAITEWKLNGKWVECVYVFFFSCLSVCYERIFHLLLFHIFFIVCFKSLWLRRESFVYLFSVHNSICF